MNIQPEKEIDLSKEEFFEHALKKISVPAFDALLTCGVRSLNDLLRLTSEDMREAGLSKHIISELMSIPLQIRKETSVPNGENSECNRNDIPTQSVLQIEPEPSQLLENSPLDLEIGTPIPNELIARLPTRARNILARERILTIEHLLEFQEEDLFGLVSIGRKTVHDIRVLQDKVIKIIDNVPPSSVIDTPPEKPLIPSSFQDDINPCGHRGP